MTSVLRVLTSKSGEVTRWALGGKRARVEDAEARG
jgi:hypothetical protein